MSGEIARAELCAKKDYLARQKQKSINWQARNFPCFHFVRIFAKIALSTAVSTLFIGKPTKDLQEFYDAVWRNQPRWRTISSK